MGQPTGGGGGTSHVDPDAIRALGARIQQAIGADLTTAAGHVPELKRIEDSNFTSTTRALATAYVLALEFAEQQLKTAYEHVETVGGGLVSTADAWEKADQQSTITPR